jgi:hypothetical protein
MRDVGQPMNTTLSAPLPLAHPGFYVGPAAETAHRGHAALRRVSGGKPQERSRASGSIGASGSFR